MEDDAVQTAGDGCTAVFDEHVEVVQAWEYIEVYVVDSQHDSFCFQS
jgi:hypothetical protein